MATFSSGIDTEATGPLELVFEMSEERAQDIFGMLLGTAAPIIRINEDTGESYQDARHLGECLRDEIFSFILNIESRAIEFKKQQAAKEAVAAVTDVSEVEEVTP